MAFPQMRRKKQELSPEECVDILASCTTGCLGVIGNDGYPYVVPLNYIYWNGCIYFHCAGTGHKIDAIRENPKTSFCVVEKDEVISEKFATSYRSVILFGNADIVDDPIVKMDALRMFGLKYNPDEEAVMEEIRPSFERTTMVRIEIEHMTGKKSLDLLD